MNHQSHRRSVLMSAVWACLSTALATASAAPATPKAPEAIQNLGDGRVMEELSKRGLDSLLDRLFDTRHVPEDQRQGIRTLHALNDLNDPNLKLTNAERSRKVKQVVAGIGAALPSLHDPDSLVRDAATLLEYGVKGDVNKLEYWGDNPATQAQLRPVVKAVVDLMDKAATEARSQADAMANRLGNGNQALADKWEKLDNLANSIKYKEDMIAYFQALAVDDTTDAGKAERAKIADSAIAALQEFDTPDSTVQPVVRLMISKLNLVKGDYKTARNMFDGIINDAAAPADKKMSPSPDPSQLYEARYFRLVADLKAGDLDAARKGLPELVAWQQQNLPKDKGVQDGLSAAADMLRYRIAAAESELAKTPDAKKKSNDEAVAILNQLLKDHKEFAPIINELLITRIPPTESVTKLDTLVLQALLKQALTEKNKAEGQKVNTAIIQRGIDAAKEILNRKDVAKTDPQLADDAAILIPNLQEKLGKIIEAANGYIDYAVKAQAANLPQAKESLDRAGFLTFELKKKTPEPIGLSDLYDRFLQVAINKPFDHKELAYLYGKRLEAQDKPREAAAFFRQVPSTDRSYLNAQYYLLICLQDELDKKLDAAERKQVIADIGKTGETVKQLAGASTDARDRFKAAHATLIAADLAVNEQKDPKKALSLLSEFEQQVKGLQGEKELLAKGLFVRVNSYMALGQLDQATGALVALLDKTEGSTGIGMVRDLLDQLDKQYVKADLVNDVAVMRNVAKNEAQLTGFLVNWAKNNKDAKIRAYTYQYRVYDARTKRLAATLEEDPQLRKKDLAGALELYKDLQAPENVALYRKTLDPKKVADGSINPNDPDVAVEVGAALTEFELGDYTSSADKLGDLLGNRRLGSPQVEVVENGETKVKDNDLYWEATYKFLKASEELCKKDPQKLKNIGLGVKQILVRGGIPERWQDEFESLRKDLIPDFQPPKLGQQASTTQPASPGTQPTAASK